MLRILVDLNLYSVINGNLTLYTHHCQPIFFLFLIFFFWAKFTLFQIKVSWKNGQKGIVLDINHRAASSFKLLSLLTPFWPKLLIIFCYYYHCCCCYFLLYCVHQLVKTFLFFLFFKQFSLFLAKKNYDDGRSNQLAKIYRMTTPSIPVGQMIS